MVVVEASKGNSMNEFGTAYVYDGSLEGMLSAVFASYERHELPAEVVRESVYVARLDQETVRIATDFQRALRVRKGVERRAGRDAFTAIMRASTCDDYETGSIVYRFVRYVMDDPLRNRSNPVLDELANPVVDDLQRLVKRAVNESEKMRQFVRFTHLENGVWYARCNPNASVIPLVMGYFAARLNDEPFIIYDENPRIAGLYDGREWSLVSGEAVPAAAESARELEMQEAWKRFYDALSIDARYNPELCRHFMPVRLWRNLTELQPRRGGRQEAPRRS